MVLGILGGETPVITEMARQNSKEDGESWAVAKRIYRLLENEHIETGAFYEGLYEVGCVQWSEKGQSIWVAAVDPVNFEKPYVKAVARAPVLCIKQLHLI